MTKPHNDLTNKNKQMMLFVRYKQTCFNICQINPYNVEKMKLVGRTGAKGNVGFESQNRQNAHWDANNIPP